MSFLKNIDWSPVSYDEAAVVATVAGEALETRLDWMRLKPRVMLDVGSGTGAMGRRLRQRYPDATVFALDLALPMVKHGQQQTGLASLCADTLRLPFRAQSIDLIFSNLLLPWHNQLPLILQEWRRVLRPDGLLLFTTFGPDTLHEWQAVLGDDHLPARMDLHDVGDGLLQAGFKDPVIEVDHYTLTYQTKEKLVRDLVESGMIAQDQVPRVLSHPMPMVDGVWPVTYEIVYAHAFGAAPVQRQEEGVVKVPLSALKRGNLSDG